MWWIFEGVDLVGKTTLAKQFSTDSRIPIFDLTRPKNLKDTESWNTYVQEEMGILERLISKNIENTILDRVVWFSEQAYAPVFRPESDLYKKLFDRGKSWNIRIVIVYVFTEYETKILRAKKRDEEKYQLTRELDQKLCLGYDSALRNLPPRPFVRINTTHSDEITSYEAFIQFSNQRGWFNEKILRDLRRSKVGSRLRL